jgi:hypothetical protein
MEYWESPQHPKSTISGWRTHPWESKRSLPFYAKFVVIVVGASSLC